MRVVHVDPPELGTHGGLAYAAFRPASEPRARLVSLHGAGSQKENQYAWGRSCRARGIAAMCFDMRGHGESSGALDGRALDDVAAMAALLGPPELPLLLRGSSMGGFLALAAGVRLEARAVIAICPAPGEHLVRAMRAGTLPPFGVDVEGFARLAATVSEERAATALGERLLLMHAAGDETVPVEVSRALHAAAPGSRYIEVPGGHHRSVQHDGELQAASLRWLDQRLR